MTQDVGLQFRCWRKGVPGRILVARCFRGVVASPFAVSGGKGKAVIANHLRDHVEHVLVG